MPEKNITVPVTGMPCGNGAVTVEKALIERVLSKDQRPPGQRRKGGIFYPLQSLPGFLRKYHPILAALDMAMSSIIVLSNSLRLYRTKHQ